MEDLAKQELLKVLQQVLDPIHSELKRLSSKIDQSTPSAFLHVECGSSFSPLSASDEEKVHAIVRRMQAGEEFEDLTEESFCK